MKPRTWSSLAMFWLALATAGHALAQPPDDFPISNRLAIGGSIGVSKNPDPRSHHGAADLSLKLDVPATVGSRVRVELGRVRWFYQPNVEAPRARAREPIVVRRATVSLVRTFVPPLEGSRTGTYAGFGLGAYRLSDATGDHYVGHGVQAVAGIEHVLPCHRHAITADAQLFFASGDSAGFASVHQRLPSAIAGGALSLGMMWRF